MHILQKKVICMAKQSQTEFARRRQALLEDSLLNLLETKRFSEITVKDICQEADIPRRTFYHYFECKEDVLDALVDDLMMDCYTQVQFEFFAGAAVLKESFERMFCFWQGENRRKLDALIKNGLEARLQNHASNWIRSEQVSFFRDDTMDPKFEQIGTMVGSAGLFSLEDSETLCQLLAAWPRFAAHQWLLSRDDGLYASSYAPCQVRYRLAGAAVRLNVESGYPVSGSIRRLEDYNK